MDKKEWLKLVSEIQSIAQAGITYTKGDFDTERYLRLRELAAELAAIVSDKNLLDIKNFFAIEKGYQTPKIAVRSFVLNDEKILLVKEKTDNLWSLPGGWADVNESPAESIARETREETGYEVLVKKLLAIWDPLKHGHPLRWPHAYSCFFHCDIKSHNGLPKENIEVHDHDFFAFDKLPELSTPRVTKNQIFRLYELLKQDGPTHFD